MRFNPTARPGYLAPALGLVLVTAVSACSSSASSSTTVVPPASSVSAPATTASPATSASGGSNPGSTSSPVSQVTANWNEFFNPSTPNSKRVDLLQNGSQFAAAIAAFSSSPLASAVTSKVDSVTLSSSTEAKVKYDLSALGQTVAKDASGTAVLQDGTWKVGDSVFCGLLSEAKGAGLTIPVPAACASAS